MKLIPLTELKKNEKAIIRSIVLENLKHKIDLDSEELESRLLEIGLNEGTGLKVAHFGLIKKDPIGVYISGSSSAIALRRNEASVIMVERIN